MKHKILLLEGIHSSAAKALSDEGLVVEEEQQSIRGNELIERAQDMDAIGIRSKTQITPEILKALPKLKVIGAFCIGTNQINLECANLSGQPAFNAPYSNTRSVAELVISELIALARQLGDINIKAHKGVWKKSANGAFEIRGKTLGIVGYGHIGSQVSVLAESMGLKVIYFDITKKLPLGNARAISSLKGLLSESDFVSLHVPETSFTRGMITGNEMQHMKKGSYLINASRGSVVNIPNLAELLKSGHLAGAAIDVFPQEPASNKESFHSELQGLPNVILTPHIGGSTQEAQESIGLEVADSLIKYLKLGITTGAVNFPNLEIPRHKEGERLINIHKNVPGVMSEINSIASSVGANIRSQYLATDNLIGYVVMDMEKGQIKEAAEKINNLNTSIRTRIL